MRHIRCVVFYRSESLISRRAWPTIKYSGWLPRRSISSQVRPDYFHKFLPTPSDPSIARNNPRLHLHRRLLYRSVSREAKNGCRKSDEAEEWDVLFLETKEKLWVGWWQWNFNFWVLWKLKYLVILEILSSIAPLYIFIYKVELLTCEWL